MSDPVVPHTLRADYPVTHAFRTGEVSSRLIELDVAPFEVANRGFKPMVRDLRFDPRLRTVIADPDAAARAWYEENKAVSMNHMVVVKEELSQTRPDVVRELFRLFKESKARANLNEEIDMRPYGLEALRPGLELVIAYSCQQGLLRRKLDVEELFDDVTIGLK